MGTAASTRERDAIHTEMETAAVSSSKRARLGGSDRLSDLPDCLLHDILSLLGCRQAVRTSALSRRWRHLWRSMTCLNIDQREFQRSGVPPPLDVCQWDSFEDMADSLLSTSITTPSAPLDAFRLHLVDGSKKTGVDRWIRRGLARRPAAVDIHYGYGYVGRVCWPDTSRLASGATCRLTRLRLFGVQLSPSFGRDLGDQCPVLEDLHIENCREDFCTVASPTLKSFALVSPSDYSYRSSALVLAVPHLASLRLVLPFSGYRGYAVATSENEVLASLVQASICIKDMDDEVQRNRRVMKPHKLDFLKSMCNFLACIPNVRNLHLSGFTTTALLGKEPQEFQVFHDLKTLLLSRCDLGVSYQALTSILRNAQNLENVGMHFCRFLERPKRRGKAQPKSKPSKRRNSTLLEYKNLKVVEIKHETNSTAPLENIFLEISKGMPKEMPLTRWHRLEKLSKTGPMTIVRLRLFRTENGEVKSN
ncbi:hypothetical protein VPH35_079134 [Triticum aestivum]|uniref:MEIOTIC F-BOX protein MOF-like n=1 Tax=Triticum aestivum TaxID=4565 RepID=UPI001D0209F0|nr:MEIOTIC F-BOX protein MOF-like [Triticum aestivum]